MAAKNDKGPVDSADTLGVKNLVKIALSCTVSEKNMFLSFTQKFKMAAKMMGRRFLRKVASRICKYSGGPKFCGNNSMSHCFRDKCALCRNSRSTWQESNFWQKSWENASF